MLRNRHRQRLTKVKHHPSPRHAPNLPRSSSSSSTLSSIRQTLPSTGCHLFALALGYEFPPSHMQKHTNTYTHTHIHKYIHKYTYTYTYAHTHIHTRAHSYTEKEREREGASFLSRTISRGNAHVRLHLLNFVIFFVHKSTGVAREHSRRCCICKGDKPNGSKPVHLDDMQEPSSCPIVNRDVHRKIKSIQMHP
jgi:hypothetical protein